MPWNNVLGIALAGAVGTLARYGLAGVVQSRFGIGFPWGTLCVNMLGCFLFGVVWETGEDRMIVSPETRTILLVGFMGAFTTFSTFISESTNLLTRGEFLSATLNISCQLGAGILLFVLGLALGRMI